MDTLKHNTINLSKSDLQDFMYSSWRYFIGRHTIHAFQHASTIQRIILDNPGVFSDANNKFNAADIRRCISDILHYCDNIHITGFNDNVDALTLLIGHIVDVHPQDDIEYLKGNEFDINMGMRAVKATPLAEGCNSIDVTSIIDLGVWCRLANWLDPHHMVEINSPEGKSEMLCTAWPAIDYQHHTMEILYHDVQSDRIDRGNVYIDPEIITNVSYVDTPSR